MFEDIIGSPKKLKYGDGRCILRVGDGWLNCNQYRSCLENIDPPDRSGLAVCKYLKAPSNCMCEKICERNKL